MDALFSGINWDEVDLLSLEENWRKDLEQVASQNISSLEKIAETEKSLLGNIKNVKSEFENLDALLSHYTEKLHGADMEIREILDVSQKLGIQTKSYTLLLDFVTLLLERLSLDNKMVECLERGSFADQEMIEKMCGHINTLDIKIKQKFPAEMSRIALIKDRMLLFTSKREAFAARLESHFIEYFRSRIDSSGWLEPDQKIYSEVFKWLRLFEFLRDTFPKKHLSVVSAYNSSLGVLYKKDTELLVGRFLSKRQAEEARESMFCSMVLFKGEPDRLEEQVVFSGDCLDFVLLSTANCISAEKELLTTFFYGFYINTTQPKEIRKINGSLESIFSPLQKEIAGLVDSLFKRSSISSAESAIVLDHRLLENKASKMVFFDRMLRTLKTQTLENLRSFVLNTIKEIILPLPKKRADFYFDFVVFFSSMTEKIELVYEKTFAAIEKKKARVKDRSKTVLPCRKVINENYTLLINAITSSFAELEKAASSEKERENVLIMLMQNTFFLSKTHTTNTVLAAMVKEMQEKFEVHSSLYLQGVMEILFGDLYSLFLELHQRMEMAISEEEDPTEMAFFAKYNKAKVEKALSVITPKTLEKNANTLKKRIEKHFKATEDLFSVITENIKTRSKATIAMFYRVIEVVYKNAVILQLCFTEDDLDNVL
eukprot:GHVN01063725.1.p1 GENE.GHVN01063725.1~~GHVN01063725.1.p1  ORF type:complete len:658 (-),score=87.03 GHVN01063725.1:5648-7621(-)